LEGFWESGPASGEAAEVDEVEWLGCEGVEPWGEGGVVRRLVEGHEAFDAEDCIIDVRFAVAVWPCAFRGSGAVEEVGHEWGG
jgi:hypothetical protein